MPNSVPETQQTMTKNSPKAVSGLSFPDYSSCAPLFSSFLTDVSSIQPWTFLNEKYVVHDVIDRTETAQDHQLPLRSNIWNNGTCQVRLFGSCKQIKYKNYHLTRQEVDTGSALTYVGVSRMRCLRHCGEAGIVNCPRSPNVLHPGSGLSFSISPNLRDSGTHRRNNVRWTGEKMSLNTWDFGCRLQVLSRRQKVKQFTIHGKTAEVYIQK